MSESPEASESALRTLVLLVRSGDRASLGRWYELEFGAVWRLALGLLADSAEAEDVAQETMLHLNSKLHLWDSARPYLAWRTRIVVNRCRDRQRRSGARRAAEQRAAEANTLQTLTDPAAEAHAAETRQVLQTCLASLSEREREVFVLRDLQGTPTAEVAATLEITESSVRSLSTLARRRLRKLLAHRVPGLVRGLEKGDA